MVLVIPIVSPYQFSKMQHEKNMFAVPIKCCSGKHVSNLLFFGHVIEIYSTMNIIISIYYMEHKTESVCPNTQIIFTVINLRNLLQLFLKI
jgi:hypothetical protein